MARRVGSARAVNTCSAMASAALAAPGSGGGIEVGDQLAELAPPASGVVVVGLAVGVVAELGEAGFDDGEAGARRGRLQGELDVGAAWVLFRKAVDVPGEAEDGGFFEAFYAHVGGVAVIPLHPGLAAGAQVDACLVAEPGAQAF